MKAAAFLALGVVLLVATVWARRGRSETSRWWTGGPMSESTILFVLPGLGIMAIAAGLAPVADEWAASNIAVGFLAIGGILIGLWGITPLPLPQKWFPSWAWEESWTRENRERKARKREAKARRRD